MPEQLLGKMGRQLWEYANGLDKSPVKPRHAADPVKSVGNGTTFPDDLVRWEQICAGLMPLCDSVAARLRRHGLYAGGVSVTLKDVSFKTFSRQTRLDAPTHLVRDIYRAAADLARQLWKPPARLRSMTVTALYVTETCSTFQQLDLLDSTAQACGQRQEQLEEAVDAIRQNTAGRPLPSAMARRVRPFRRRNCNTDDAAVRVLLYRDIPIGHRVL